MTRQIEKGDVAIFIDERNMFREEFDFSVEDLEEVVSQYGDLQTKEAFFDPFYERNNGNGNKHPHFIEGMLGKFFRKNYEVYMPGAREFEGWEDCKADGFLAARIMQEAIQNGDALYMAIASRDGHFSGLIPFIHGCGKKVLSIGSEYSSNGSDQLMASSLVRHSDYCELIESEKRGGVDGSKYDVLNVFETSSGFRSFYIDENLTNRLNFNAKVESRGEKVMN